LAIPIVERALLARAYQLSLKLNAPHARQFKLTVLNRRALIPYGQAISQMTTKRPGRLRRNCQAVSKPTISRPEGGARRCPFFSLPCLQQFFKSVRVGEWDKEVIRFPEAR